MRPKTPFAIAALIAFTLAPPILARDNESGRETLRGIPAIFVVIEGLDPDLEKDGLSKSQLQTDVELKLRLAGIKVLTWEQGRFQPGAPFLYLNIATSKKIGLYAFTIRLAFHQDAQLLRNNHLTAGVST